LNNNKKLNIMQILVCLALISLAVSFYFGLKYFIIVFLLSLQALVVGYALFLFRMIKNNKKIERIARQIQLLDWPEPMKPEELKKLYERYPLAAGSDLIKEWIVEGINQGAEYLFIVTDRFDWHDYPVYVMPGDDPEEVRLKNTGDLVSIDKEFRLLR
jgi:hypothetical protein